MYLFWFWSWVLNTGPGVTRQLLRHGAPPLSSVDKVAALCGLCCAVRRPLSGSGRLRANFPLGEMLWHPGSSFLLFCFSSTLGSCKMQPLAPAVLCHATSKFTHIVALRMGRREKLNPQATCAVAAPIRCPEFRQAVASVPWLWGKRNTRFGGALACQP